MNYFKIIPAILILSGCFIAGCNSADKTSSKTEKNDPGVNTIQHPYDTDELKTGGLYLFKNEDSSYRVVKILVIDEFAVHNRMYADTFYQVPQQINSANLHILIGHAPLDKQGFLAEKPKLLKVEEVKESELEGYKMYLEAMKNGN